MYSFIPKCILIKNSHCCGCMFLTGTEQNYSINLPFFYPLSTLVPFGQFINVFQHGIHHLAITRHLINSSNTWGALNDLLYLKSEHFFNSSFFIFFFVSVGFPLISFISHKIACIRDGFSNEKKYCQFPLTVCMGIPGESEWQ